MLREYSGELSRLNIVIWIQGPIFPKLVMKHKLSSAIFERVKLFSPFSEMFSCPFLENKL